MFEKKAIPVSERWAIAYGTADAAELRALELLSEGLSTCITEYALEVRPAAEMPEDGNVILIGMANSNSQIAALLVLAMRQFQNQAHRSDDLLSAQLPVLGHSGRHFHEFLLAHRHVQPDARPVRHGPRDLDDQGLLVPHAAGRHGHVEKLRLRRDHCQGSGDGSGQGINPFKQPEQMTLGLLHYAIASHKKGTPILKSAFLRAEKEGFEVDIAHKAMKISVIGCSLGDVHRN